LDIFLLLLLEWLPLLQSVIIYLKICPPLSDFPSLISCVRAERVDYHGKDKSRIDTRPFTEAIIKACRRIADGIQTFKAAGYEFETKHSRSFAPIRERTKTIEDVIGEVIKQWI
jgi:hypothetical protein